MGTYKSLYNLIRNGIGFIHIVLLLGCGDDSPADDNGFQIEVPDGWELVWFDEFEGDNINPMLWEHEVNAQGGGNNELQYYTDRQENSHVSDGSLVITARRETYSGSEGTREFTSARMRTKYRGDWQYGRFEVRGRMPVGQGLWPAIWLLPTDWVYGGWPLSGEIDIMEMLGHEPNIVYGTIHFGNSWPENSRSGGSYTSLLGGFDTQFHTFAMEWDSTEFRWYVDDQHYLTKNSWFTPAAEYPAPFDQRFHLIFNVAIGGNWPGDPDDTTTFPQIMEIDYVRVFKRESD